MFWLVRVLRKPPKFRKVNVVQEAKLVLQLRAFQLNKMYKLKASYSLSRQHLFLIPNLNLIVGSFLLAKELSRYLRELPFPKLNPNSTKISYRKSKTCKY